MSFLDQIARYFDPLAFLLVVGGSFAAAAARASREEIARGFDALGPLFRDRPEADAAVAMRTVNAITALAEIRGIACVDRVRTAGLFLRRAAFQLSNSPNADAFLAWGEEDLGHRQRRHAGAIGFWRAMADSAPSMGMIGTIIGLVQMFARMDDAERIGPAMALAMLTTLYGILLAAVVAGPIAARLERLSDAELAWQRGTIERLARLARAEAETSSKRGKVPLRTIS